MRELALPELTMPSDALVLYEHMIVDRDRSDNWRFYFRDDGAFFNARNGELRVTKAQITVNDANLFWNTPFAEAPTRQLGAELTSKLLQVIDEAKIESLKSYYPDSRFETTSPPWIDRWTFVKGDKVYTIVIECHATPPELAQLNKTIGQLLSEASKQ